MPFVKLDTGILNSTLWIDRDSREVFITALLMAEPAEFTQPIEQIEVNTLKRTGFVAPSGWYGFVPAAGCGIVRRSGLDMEAGMKALERLGSADKESRSSEFEGRRLIRIDGGYLVLNYMKYRDRDYTGAERARRYRERVKVKSSRRDNVESRRDDTVTSRMQSAECRVQSAEAEGEEKTIGREARATDGPGMEWIPAGPKPEKSRLEPWQIEGAQLVWSEIKATYPPGTYRTREFLVAEKRYYQIVEEQHIKPGTLLNRVTAYAEQQKALGNIGTQFIMSPSKFFDADNWNDPFPLPAPKGGPKAPRVKLRTADEIEADEAREAASRGN